MALISRRNWSNFPLSMFWGRQSWFGSEIEAWGEEGVVGDIYWVCCFDKGQRGHQPRYSSAVCSFYTILLWNVSIGAILGMWQCLQSKAEQDIGGDVCWGFREYNGLKSWHPYITGWGTGGKDGGERSGELKFMNWSNMIKKIRWNLFNSEKLKKFQGFRLDPLMWSINWILPRHMSHFRPREG